jgi:hypothetical protein
VPARRDRRLGELQLAHVALGQEHRGGRVLAAPVQDEHALLADLRQPRRQAGVDGSGLLVGDEPPGAVEEPAVHELGDAVDEARPAHPGRLGVADHLQARLVTVDANALDRAVRGPHAAADLRRLERRPGRRGGRHHALGRAERDLAVRPDVDEQPHAAVAR